jgi:hypothetical protein
MEIGKHLPSIAVGVGYNWTKMNLRQQIEQTKNFRLALAMVSVPISDCWGSSLSKRNTPKCSKPKTPGVRNQTCCKCNKSTTNRIRRSNKSRLPENPFPLPKKI